MHHIGAGFLAIVRLADQLHCTIGAAKQLHAARLDHRAGIGRGHTQEKRQRDPAAQHYASQALERGERERFHAETVIGGEGFKYKSHASKTSVAFDFNAEQSATESIHFRRQLHAAQTLVLALYSSRFLALALSGGLFVKLAGAQVGEKAELFDGAFEAAQSDFIRLGIFNTDKCHCKCFLKCGRVINPSCNSPPRDKKVRLAGVTGESMIITRWQAVFKQPKSDRDCAACRRWHPK
jgi:hypothetical protein